MMDYEIKPNLKRILKKLSRKDKNLYEQIMNKIQEIINSLSFEHYKNLRYNLKEYKRIHIGHFVLVFRFDKSRDLISFEDFQHHDCIYYE